MRRVLALALCAVLAGCATCRDHDGVVLHPPVMVSPGFEATSNVPNGADLLLKSDDVSLLLTPCIFEWRQEPFTLCARLMVPAGRTIRFTSATADLVIAASGEHRPLSLANNSFNATQALVGADRSPHTIMWGVYEPAKQELTRRTWYIKLLRAPLAEPATLTLPAFTINGRDASFPQISLAPATMHVCVQLPV